MNIPSFLSVLLLVLLNLGTVGVTNVLAGDSDCGECHESTVRKGKANRYVHAPFQRNQCAACHVAGEKSADPSRSATENKSAVASETLDWFYRSGAEASSHLIELPSTVSPESIFYRARSGRDRSPIRPLPFDARQVKTSLTLSSAPQVSRLRVADIRKGIRCTATLRWSSSEFARAEIHYGVDALNLKIEESRYLRDHSVLLKGLEPGRLYRYEVTVIDARGQRSAVAAGTFMTDKSLIEATEAVGPGSVGLGEIAFEFYKDQGRYFVKLQSDRLFSMDAGVGKKTEAQQGAATEAAQTTEGTDTKSHPVLKSRLDTNVTSCHGCHRALKEVYSHPINVRPKPGMIIPPEYPLLLDGRLSCMSCHAVHGSNYEFRLLKPSKKELCLGCHQDY